MEKVLFDSLTNEEQNIIMQTLDKDLEKVSFEDAKNLTEESCKLIIYSSLKLNFVSAELLNLFSVINEKYSKKVQIELILIEKNTDNSRFLVDYIQDLKRNGTLDITIVAELDKDNLKEDLTFLSKAKTTVESKNNVQENDVVIYTDGACSGNPGAGGWGAILMHGNRAKEISGFEANTTNNRMELTAVIKALQMLKSPCSVELYSDSAYVVNAFLQGWLENWKNNGWIGSDKKQVKNLELWQELDRLMSVHSVHFNKVKGHADNEYNNRCDALATGEIAQHANIE